jgi:hypothetical protein
MVAEVAELHPVEAAVDRYLRLAIWNRATPLGKWIQPIRCKEVLDLVRGHDRL